MNKIKNIIFDLGGVILNLDVPKTIIAFERLGITNIVNDTGHHYRNAMFYDFEMGKISEFEFIEKLSHKSSLKASANDIREAWNAMILDVPREKIDFISSLKADYNLFLLSNTNSIHQKKFLNEFEAKYAFNFNDLFKKAYYSHEIGMRKPNEEVFRFVLKDSSLLADETIFIDDSLDHVTAAQREKIKTVHLPKGNLLETLTLLGIGV